MGRSIQKVNTKKDEVRAGRKIRKARNRLAARIDGYEQTVKNSRTNASAFRRPGSLKAK